MYKMFVHPSEMLETDEEKVKINVISTAAWSFAFCFVTLYRSSCFRPNFLSMFYKKNKKGKNKKKMYILNVYYMNIDYLKFY